MMSRAQRRVAADIAQALRDVSDTYVPEGVGIWLTGRKRSLDACSPLEILERGEVQEFCAAARRLVSR